MIFMFLGVAAGVKLACTALDLVHTSADARRASKTGGNLKALGPVIPYRPPVRLYSTVEEGMCGEDEGSFPEHERAQARLRAEARFASVAKDWPRCSHCGEPVMNPKKYFERVA